MTEKAETAVQTTEIHFTDEQAELISKAIETEIKKKNGKFGFFGTIAKGAKSIFNATVSFAVSFITLKNSGKWVSVGTIGVILWLVWQFLAHNAYSIQAMTIVMPGISQLGIVVFGVIGSFTGIQKIASGNSVASTAIKKLFGSAEPSTPEGEDEGA